LKAIYDLFFKNNQFGEKLHEVGIGYLPQIFNSILELRHKFAHVSPSLRMNLFSNPKIKPLEDYLKKVKIDTSMEDEPDIKSIPHGLHKIFHFLIELFKEKQEILILIVKIPNIVLTYVGLIEDILLARLDKSNLNTED